MKFILFFCLINQSIFLFAQQENKVQAKLDTMSQHTGEICVKRYIVYPMKEREEGIEGTVYVDFNIEKDGTMDSIRIIKGVEAGLDSAALNAVKSMPKKWVPLKEREQFTLPVKFTLIK